MGGMIDPNNPPRYHISTTIANPIPTSTGHAIAWGSYAGLVVSTTVIVLVIVVVAGCAMMQPTARVLCNPAVVLSQQW